MVSKTVKISFCNENNKSCIFFCLVYKITFLNIYTKQIHLKSIENYTASVHIYKIKLPIIFLKLNICSFLNYKNTK